MRSGEFCGDMSGAMVCHSATSVWDQSSWHRWAATASYCICGAAWSSCWLMTQLTNGKCAVALAQGMLCAFARVSGGHFEHTLWPSVCFLCTWWTLCFTPCLTQHIIFKECIINVWYVMFSFSLGSASTLFRWDGHFCHICIKYFFLLTTVQKLFFLKSIKIFQSYDHKMYCYLFMVHSVDSDSCMMLLPWMWLYCWYVWLLSLWICLDM